MSKNLYYKTSEDGEVICLTPRDQMLMGRRCGKTMLGLKIMMEASDTPEKAPVIAPELVLLDVTP